jgi:hypothetical protein
LSQQPPINFPVALSSCSASPYIHKCRNKARAAVPFSADDLVLLDEDDLPDLRK